MRKEIMEGFRHKCPMCGKGFSAQSDWAYKMNNKKTGTVYFCSWNCKRKREAELEKMKREEELAKMTEFQKEILKEIRFKGDITGGRVTLIARKCGMDDPDTLISPKGGPKNAFIFHDVGTDAMKQFIELVKEELLTIDTNEVNVLAYGYDGDPIPQTEIGRWGKNYKTPHYIPSIIRLTDKGKEAARELESVSA